MWEEAKQKVVVNDLAEESEENQTQVPVEENVGKRQIIIFCRTLPEKLRAWRYHIPQLEAEKMGLSRCL